jgi:serine/threonine protein phosphatase PrpC
MSYLMRSSLLIPPRHLKKHFTSKKKFNPLALNLCLFNTCDISIYIMFIELMRILVQVQNYQPDRKPMGQQLLLLLFMDEDCMLLMVCVHDYIFLFYRCLHCLFFNIIVAGDSRCIVVQRGGKVRPMSVDHKPNR